MMTGSQEDIQRITAELIRQAEQAGTSGISGSHASSIVRTLKPDFKPQSYDVATLKEFIQKYVPSFQIIGFAGLDPVYGLADQLRLPTQEVASPSADLWRVWVSPAAPVAISVSRTKGTCRAVPPGQTPQAQEVEIRPASMEIHRRVAQDFLATSGAPESVASALATALADSRVLWWRRWMEILQNYPELSQRWQSHRRQGLETALRAALTGAGLDAPIAECAFKEITRSRTSPPPKGPAIKSTGLPQVHVAEGLTSLVQAVIARMGAEELRSLSLPLGLVLDVLRREDAGR